MRRTITVLLILLSLCIHAPAQGSALSARDLGFSLAPSYSSADTLQTAIDQALAQGDATFVARLTAISLLDVVRDHLTLRGASFSFSSSVYENGQTDVWVDLEVPVGMKVARAAKVGNEAALSGRERDVLNVAREVLSGIVTDDMDALAREFAIHDYLTHHVTYALDGDVADAYGALCLGRARCSGYADAFYLLGSMAGLTVQKIHGMASDVAHEWNVILLDDLWYFVDVTWDDPIGGDPNHVYLNVPPHVMADTHHWNKKNEPGPIAQAFDQNNYFFAKNLVAMNAEELANLVATPRDDHQPLELLYPSILDVNTEVYAALSRAAQSRSLQSGGVQYASRSLGEWICLMISFE